MVLVYSNKRSARVLFPWSIWAIMQKFRMFFIFNLLNDKPFGVAKVRYFGDKGKGFGKSLRGASCGVRVTSCELRVAGRGAKLYTSLSPIRYLAITTLCRNTPPLLSAMKT